MSKKNLTSFLLGLLIFSQFAVNHNIAQSNSPRHSNEQLVIKALQTIHAAQVTYQSTSGNGDYGSNLDLREAKFIDAVLAEGNKYGYYFMFSSSRRTAAAPSKFHVTATPQNYNKTGKMSFYIDETGEIHGADKGGWVATKTDPIIEPCAEYEYEKCTIAALRNTLGAQGTYQSSVGNGSFGTFKQLYAANLIGGQKMASGLNHGYRFTLIIVPQTSEQPAFFRISAVPVKYGITGVRSFYFDLEGIVHGADKKGKSADKNDPVIDFCFEEERCAAYELQTIHAAQMTYQATVGNDNFGSLNELYAAGLINKSLASGVFRGYRFTLTIVPRTSETPAFFKVSAVPEKYGVTGTKSFYIAVDGVTHGADKNGEPADENDPLF